MLSDVEDIRCNWFIGLLVDFCWVSRFAFNPTYGSLLGFGVWELRHTAVCLLLYQGGEKMIGSLQKVDLRKVWPHEAQDFTPWLEENIDVLNRTIDLSLSDRSA